MDTLSKPKNNEKRLQIQCSAILRPLKSGLRVFPERIFPEREFLERIFLECSNKTYSSNMFFLKYTNSSKIFS